MKLKFAKRDGNIYKAILYASSVLNIFLTKLLFRDTKQQRKQFPKFEYTLCLKTQFIDKISQIMNQQ